MNSSSEHPSSRIRTAVLFGGLVLELAGLTTVVSCATSSDPAEDPLVDTADARSTEDAESSSTDPAGDASSDAPDGAEWHPITTPHDSRLGLSAIWGTGKNDVWAVGAAGSVLHWDGSSWTSATVGTKLSLNVVGGALPNDVWVATSLSEVFHIDGFDAGTLQWSAATPIRMFSDQAFLYAAWASSPSDVWFGGTGADSQNMWKTSASTTGELAWRQMANTPPTLDNGFTAPTIYGIWGSRADDVWCVGMKNSPSPPSFAAHLDGLPPGEDMPTWTELDTQSNSPLNAVWGADANDVWAVGDHGTIRRFRGTPKAGALWEVVASPTTEHLRGLWGSSSSDIWAVGEHGTFLHFDGTTWRSAPAVFASDRVPNLRAVWGADSEHFWAVGDGIVMRHASAGAQGVLP
ncbi:MAG: hypothetical protein J0I07_15165 [Myxococcales bacterium]|nr:hypothetical protein [Myxococcales bacterium]